MDRGGAESMIMNYYRHIDRTKVQFDFLVHKQEKGAFDDEIESLGGQIYRIKSINPFFPKQYYKELRQFFKTHSGHYKIIHSHLNTFSSFPLKIAKEFNIPVRIAHAHTSSQKISIKDFLNRKNAKEALKILVKMYLKTNILTYTTHCFSCGDKAGKSMFGKHSNFKIINNAIDTSCFMYNKTTELEYRDQLNLKDKLIIGHIGNFTEPKNHNFILEVFNEFIKINKQEAVLLLVGDGPLKTQIEEKSKRLNIQDRTLFLGSRSDVANLCQIMDFFIFPSIYEGLPVTLIEAQAAGIKILASDTITKEVQITNDIKFLSINNVSAKSWAKAILSLYPYVKKNNFNMIQKSGYDIKSNAHVLQEFYQKQNNNMS
tara:strand:+ start:12225 stop:13343 length:1119 start_codon:yes stop_codon:yes gene_type:complete